METDLRMAMELQQALLPKEYPLFPSTAPVQSTRLRLPTSTNRRVWSAVISFTSCDFRSRGGRLHLRRDGPRCSFRAYHRNVAGANIAAEGVNLADPGLLMTHVNRELTTILKQTGTVLFVTALYCVIDCEQMAMRTRMPAINRHCTRGARQAKFISPVASTGPPGRRSGFSKARALARRPRN